MLPPVALAPSPPTAAPAAAPTPAPVAVLDGATPEDEHPAKPPSHAIVVAVSTALRTLCERLKKVKDAMVGRESGIALGRDCSTVGELGVFSNVRVILRNFDTAVFLQFPRLLCPAANVCGESTSFYCPEKLYS